MPCDAAVSVRIVEADSGQLVQETCDRVQASNACSLFDLDRVTFFDIPPVTVRLEVAAWRPEQLGWGPTEVGDCPDEDIFNLQGVPRADFVPQPAFGGATYFDVSSPDTAIAVPLACTDPNQLNDAECVSPSVVVTAFLRDMDGLLNPIGDPIDEAQAASLFLVAVAEPTARLDADNNTIYSINEITPLTLKLPIDAMRSFQGFATRSFEDIVCVAMQDDSAQPITLVSCDRVLQPNPFQLTVEGNYMPRTSVEQLLQAALGDPRVPPAGFVIGRVVDATGAALAGVTVQGGLSTVHYINEDRTGLTLVGSETSSSGFFVSPDAELDTNWTATHADGRVSVDFNLGGLIQNRVSLLTITMGPPQ